MVGLMHEILGSVGRRLSLELDPSSFATTHRCCLSYSRTRKSKANPGPPISSTDRFPSGNTDVFVDRVCSAHGTSCWARGSRQRNPLVGFERLAWKRNRSELKEAPPQEKLMVFGEDR